MTTALVTGGSGFIGGHLVEALLGRGRQVRCLVRPTSVADHLRRPGVELIEGDLHRPDVLEKAIAGCGVVFHLAAATCALRFSDMMRTNGVGTHHVARACARQSNPPVFVLVSSLAAAGTAPRGRRRTEAETPTPISNYGRSKRAGELAAEQLARRVPTTIVRPGIVFGERGRDMLPVFRPIARFGVHAIPGFLWRPLSLIHVADLVELLLRAADRGSRIAPSDDSPVAGKGCYFACADEYPTYADLGRLIGRAVGRPTVLLISLPEPILLLAAGVAELAAHIRGEPAVFNLDKIREATAGAWVGSPEAARRDLGFAPPVSLLGRIRQTAAWYRRHGWL